MKLDTHTLGPPALELPHFPNRICAFVWRNWRSATLDRMAAVLGCRSDEVERLGRAMGLSPHLPPSARRTQRGYITVIKRNWSLLPREQLLALLNWDEERFAETLKEDDFLWAKLGRLQPACEPMCYQPPTPETWARCAEIAAEVGPLLDALPQPEEPRFAFVDDLSSRDNLPALGPAAPNAPIRFVYSYFAVYGDPLLDPTLDPYPDGLLARLAAQGVNGVWLHTVLRQLAPSDDFPEFGEGWQTRLETLRTLVQRAGAFGIKVYLYMNEPRSMSAAFFERYPDLAGAAEDGNLALCSSVERVRNYVRDGLTHVFREVPGLGGVFTITASENLTTCWSRGGQEKCPRCAMRDPAEIVAEVNHAIAQGVWRANPDAAVIVWDWGWKDEWAESIIKQLPDNVHLMSVSEWSLPINRGGVATTVSEYSISCVGPGPRARRHWEWALRRGLRTLAKVQLNNTWELSSVPYLPTMDLVAAHLENLSKERIDGLMLSWTLGGYPSPNLALAKAFAADPPRSADDVLDAVARERFGARAAGCVRRAWTAFSRAFEAFPYHQTTVYGAPLQVGPANLLYAEPTGRGATMVGYPYDNLDTWRSVYPAEVFAGQLERVAAGWQEGLEALEAAQPEEPAQRAALQEDLRLAQAAHAHFKSVANQARFIMARDALLADDGSAAERREGLREQLRALLEDERVLAHRLARLCAQDARIGYEASNHYYYEPLDLLEKIISCQWLSRRMEL